MRFGDAIIVAYSLQLELESKTDGSAVCGRGSRPRAGLSTAVLMNCDCRTVCGRVHVVVNIGPSRVNSHHR